MLAAMSNDGALLLAIDVGNTNISFGLFDDGRATLRADWRMETRSGRTADEYVAILSELFRLAGIDLGGRQGRRRVVGGAARSSRRSSACAAPT